MLKLKSSILKNKSLIISFFIISLILPFFIIKFITGSFKDTSPPIKRLPADEPEFSILHHEYYYSIIPLDSIEQDLEKRDYSNQILKNLDMKTIETQIIKFLTKSHFVNLIGVWNKTSTEKDAYFYVNHPEYGRIKGRAIFIYFFGKGWYLESICYFSKDGDELYEWNNILIPLLN
jgi:hypothetical protein